jgi:hypothetical protein
MRRGKFNAKPTTIRHAGKDIRCASKLEAKKLAELVLLEKAGDIKDLEFHPRFPLTSGKVKVATYVADAAFFDMRANRHVVFEVKGYETPTWKIKAALFKAQYGSLAELRVVKA